MERLDEVQTVAARRLSAWRAGVNRGSVEEEEEEEEEEGLPSVQLHCYSSECTYTAKASGFSRNRAAPSTHYPGTVWQYYMSFTRNNNTNYSVVTISAVAMGEVQVSQL